MIVKEIANAIQIQSPCCLPLGLVALDGKPALLGITLLYPPIDMLVKPHNELSVTGARANLAREQAMQWFARHDLPPKAEIEIELAIPAYMGLGSEAMMGMSLARSLATGYGATPSLPGIANRVMPGPRAESSAESTVAGEEAARPLRMRDPSDRSAQTARGDTPGGGKGAIVGVEPGSLARSVGLGSEWMLEAWSHSQGGLLVAGSDGTLIRRHEIQHDEQNAWVFVIHLPRTPKDTPPSLETDRRQSLLNAAQHAGANIEPLWSALVKDDIASFGRELMAVQTRSYDALAEAGTPVELSGEAKEMLEVIRTSGAAAWGQSFGGLAAWGLIKGAGPSQDARIRMRRLMGHEGGTVTAAIPDNRGARIVST